MADKKQVVEAKTEQKTRARGEQAQVSTPGSTFLLTNGMLHGNGSAADNPPLGGPGRLIRQNGLQTAQRRELAAQIGQAHGNRHLQSLFVSPQARTNALPLNGGKHQAAEAGPHAASDLQRQKEGEQAGGSGDAEENLSWWERKKLWFFKKALGAAGIDQDQVMGLLKKAGSVIMDIIAHPGKFVSALVKAVGQGFKQFWDNISKHLISGLMGWLFGLAGDMGIEIPKDFSLQSIITLVLQIMGVTLAKVKAKVTEVIGAKNMALIERVIGVVSRLMEEGPGGLVKMLEEYLSNLKDMILDEVKSWLITQVIQAAVLKILSMFNPVSGLISIIKMIYNVVKFLIENGKKIAGLFQAIAGSIVQLASGNFQAAADKVEQTLAKLIPIAIGLLSSLLGISGIADKVKTVVQKFQAKVDKAIDWVIKKIAKGAKTLFSRFKLGAKKLAGKVKEFLFPRLPFKMGEKQHYLTGELEGENTELYIIGSKIRMDTFLSHIKTRIGHVQQEDPKTAGDANTIVTDIEQKKAGIRNIHVKHMEGKIPQGMKKVMVDINELFQKLSGMLWKKGGIKTGEGIVGTYDSGLNFPDCEMHHVPKDELMVKASEWINPFQNPNAGPAVKARRASMVAAENMTQLVKYTKGKGFIIVMSKERHKETRTFSDTTSINFQLQEMQQLDPNNDTAAENRLKKVKELLAYDMKKDIKNIYKLYNGDYGQTGVPTNDMKVIDQGLREIAIRNKTWGIE